MKKVYIVTAKHRWQIHRLIDDKPPRMFRPLKVRATSFRYFECIAGQYRQSVEPERDILMPAYSDQTMEEFLIVDSKKTA